MKYKSLRENHIVKLKLRLINKDVIYLIKKINKKEKFVSVRKIVDEEIYPNIPYIVKVPFQMILDVKHLTKKELFLLMDKDYLLGSKTFKKMLEAV